jgi:NADH:ubiquinone oxidoreductase subunit 6 (subunit J)
VITFILEDFLAVALVVSAFLALHLEKPVYAIISFGAMFTALSALYFSLNAPFAAVFQLAVAVGTIAVFFLASEMLSPKKITPQKSENIILAMLIAIGLSIPSLLLDFGVKTFTSFSGLSFSSALWDFRALDILAQGVVVLTLALGVVAVLKEWKKHTKGE